MPDNRLGSPTDFPQQPPRRRRVGWILLLLIVGLWLAASTAVSYYVDALWFASLGYADVFWKSLNIQAFVFTAFGALTFLILYGAFLALRPPRFGERGIGNVIVINGQPVSLPVGPMLRLLALVISLIVALVTGTAMMANWPELALWWYGAGTVQAGVPTDPIFGRSIAFYLFTLPAWNLIVDWLMTLAILVIAIAGFFALVGGAIRRGRLDPRATSTLRGVGLAWAARAACDGGADIPWPIRSPARRPHDLRGRHVHRSPRDLDRHVDRGGSPRAGRARRGGQRVRRSAPPVARRSSSCRLRSRFSRPVRSART